ncbi:hypothetical protein M5K25_009171 [Dendrobium thyrsiflorum]|uniref:Uncharacterized protein n=1 Tax=Dendrobium thyrsiflorum TaxID=117978 RepID=A0ABD0V567_DENTH
MVMGNSHGVLVDTSCSISLEHLVFTNSPMGVSPSIIGGFSGLSAFMGVAATFISATLVEKLGILKAGAAGLVFQSVLLATALGVFCVGSVSSQKPLFFFLLLIVLSRLGHMSYDVVGTQILQTGIPLSKANLIGTTEISIASLAEFAMLGVAIIANDVKHFSFLALLSFSCVVGAAWMFCCWLGNPSDEQRELFSLDPQFQTCQKFDMLLKYLIFEMELQNTLFTVKLGRGASIQLANAVINNGDSEATIRFGSLEFPVATAMAATVLIHGIIVQGHTARPNSAEIYARRAYSVQQPQATRTATAKAVQQNRASVFERLSHPEVSTVKRTDIKQKTLPILSSVITLPTEPFVPGRHNHEASLSIGRLSRRQRRKLNAELRARQPLPVHPSTLPALEPEANVHTQNKFTNLKWVKRNNSTGELKQTFWEKQQQTPAPQKKNHETLSARVHRVLKVARENGLMKKKYQRPFTNKTWRIPPRELPSATVTQDKLKLAPCGEHWSAKPGPRIQESVIKRSQWKGKEIWRIRLPERRLLEKNVRIGMTSSIASQRSAPEKNRQQWVPKEKGHLTDTHNSRHLGESSKESYYQLTSSSHKKINVDRTPPIEEVPVPHAEPEIYWKRRSEIRVQGKDDEEDTMEVEGPLLLKTTTSQEDQAQYEQLGEEVPSGDRQNDDQEEEVLAETLAQAQRRLKLQMKEKDKEISELNSKMTEMMSQMTAMMQLMQKNIIINPALAQPADHQSSIPTNLPTNPVPQVSEIRTTHEEENEADRLVHLQTHQNVASASESRYYAKDHDRGQIVISSIKMTDKMTSESCMMVLQTDDNSEENLCFPSDDESDQLIASQMERAKLNKDAERTTKKLDPQENTSSDEAESNEVVQVQLRSGKVLPLPLKKGLSSKDKGKDIIINEEIILKDHKKKCDTNKGIEYNIISHLRKIPAQLNIYEALLMSKDLREILIQALKNLERYEAYFAERCLSEVLHAKNEPVVTFSEEDLMLETTEHNRPLYVSAESDGIIIKQILINPGLFECVYRADVSVIASRCVFICKLMPIDGRLPYASANQPTLIGRMSLHASHVNDLCSGL